MENQMNVKLVLEDGSEFPGYSFGDDSIRDRVCTVVFNTSMVGYQEIVSDPAYTDQFVVMTYPLIGSYGMTEEDYEARSLTMGGLIVREYNDQPSNFRYTKTLEEVMCEHHIPGLWGIDTRMLTRKLRDHGSSMRGILTSMHTTTASALAMIRVTPVPTDAVARVSCKKRWYIIALYVCDNAFASASFAIDVDTKQSEHIFPISRYTCCDFNISN